MLSRIFIIPGNHDVDRSEARSVRRYDVLQDVPEFLDPTAEGKSEREMLLKRFSAFDSYQWFLENVGWVSSSNGYLARSFQIGACKVGVLCINTAWFCGKNEEKGMLSPGPEMVRVGLNDLSDCNQVFVLGHHPLNWLNADHEKKICSMLSKANAIYLHGHLHKSEQLAVSAGVGVTTAIQCGCAFVPRQGEKWLNHFIWGGLVASSGQIFLQPKKWSSVHQEWALDADAVANSLRKEGGDYWVLPTRFAPALRIEERKRVVVLPDGWTMLDERFFSQIDKEYSDARAIQYFDGRAPQWEDILSKKLPTRSIVDELFSSIVEGLEGGGPRLTLLLGAGGEGKSTAFLQTTFRLWEGNNKRKILWRHNPEKSLPLTFVSEAYKSGEDWVIVSDEADSLIDDLERALRAVGSRGRLHFFLTCRDTDWMSNKGGGINWPELSTFIERRLNGLDETDARNIVSAWTAFGPKGLGRLAGLDEDEAVKCLLNAAVQESSSVDGAFLGAMLRVRLGVALKDHVNALMARLEARGLSGVPGKTLLDAFAYIAVPHARNLQFLSKIVLARALGVEESKMRRRVLGPLGDEAAAGSVGGYILTRHRAIAEAALDALVQKFHFDSDDILNELVRAAIVAGVERQTVPQLASWRYLSSEMFGRGEESLGISLAATAFGADPNNSFLAVKLAQLYRQSGQPEQSVEVFRNVNHDAQENRAFYTEWAVGEGHLGNSAAAACLSAVAMSDEIEMRPPDRRDIGYGLCGCAHNFNALYERYVVPEFARAAMASSNLGLKLPELETVTEELLRESYEQAISNGGYYIADDELLPLFRTGLDHAFSRREIRLPSKFSSMNAFSFERLSQMLLLPDRSGN